MTAIPSRSALAPQLETVNDNFFQHSENLVVDNQNNLDLVRPDGTVIQDNVIPANEISFDSDGTFSQHTTDYLANHGFISATDALQPAPADGMSDLWFGTDKVTVSNSLHWVDNGDGTSRLVLDLQDSSGNTFESVVHANSTLSQGVPNDMAAVIQDIKNHPLLDFTHGSETIGADLPLDKVNVSSIPDIVDAAGGRHPIMAQIPDGTHFEVVDPVAHTYNLVDSNNTTLLHGVDFDTQGHVENLTNLKAEAAANHIRFGDLHETITIEGDGGDGGGTFDIRAGFLDDQTKYMGNNTVWEWGERTLRADGAEYPNFNADDNIFKNAFRAWHNFDGNNNADIVGAEVPGVTRLMHRVEGGFTMSDGNTGYQNSLDFNRLPDNLYIRDIPTSLFSEEKIGEIGNLMEDTLKEVNAFQAAEAAAGNGTANVDEVLAHLQATDELQYLAYKHGYIGQYFTESDWERFRELFEGPSTSTSTLTLHTAQIIQQTVTAAPPSIEIAGEVPNNIIIAPLAEPPQIPIPIIPIADWRGMEPGTPGSIHEITDITRGYYGYGYGGEHEIGLLDRNKYSNRYDVRLRSNKNLDLSANDSEAIQSYFQRQDPAYIQQLESIISTSEPMDPNTKLIVTIPAYHEGLNIRHTLEQYATLEHPEQFEIVILENHPADKQRDNTQQEVESFKATHPNLKVSLLYKVFDQKPPIGQVRKYLVDSVLLRKQKAGINHSLVIASHDADLTSINKSYSDRLIQAFEQDANLDGVGGKWDFPAEAFAKMPLLHASERLWQYFDIAFRKYYLKVPELIGRNSAFRSGIYAAVGGYNENAQIAEDLEIGWLIKDARGYDPKRVKYLNSASLVSNPRRAVMKLASGGKLIQQYGDFHVNEEVRKAPLDELLEMKKDFSRDEFAQEVQAIYDHYARWRKSANGWIDDKYFNQSFTKAMGLMGIKYHIENNKVILDDISALEEGMRKFKESLNPPTI